MTVRTGAGVSIDLDGYQAAIGDVTVELTRLQRDLLALLAARAGDIVTYAELTLAGWGVAAESRRRSIRNAMYAMRSTICRGEAAPAIVSVSGLGYALLEHGSTRPRRCCRTSSTATATVSSWVGSTSSGDSGSS